LNSLVESAAWVQVEAAQQRSTFLAHERLHKQLAINSTSNQATGWLVIREATWTENTLNNNNRRLSNTNHTTLPSSHTSQLLFGEHFNQRASFARADNPLALHCCIFAEPAA
jgi:hypothetical protein